MFFGEDVQELPQKMFYFGKILSSLWVISELIICASLHEKRLRPSCCLSREFEL